MTAFRSALPFVALLWAGPASATAHADECVRSEPSPLFANASKSIAAHSFAIDSSHEAHERFRLGSRVDVEVLHGGCEYFVTTLRFDSPALFMAKYSEREAYLAAARLLRELHAMNADAVFQLDLAANTLDTAARAHGEPRLDQEIPVKGDGEDFLEARVKLDAAGKRKGAGFIQVTLFRGPL